MRRLRDMTRGALSLSLYPLPRHRHKGPGDRHRLGVKGRHNFPHIERSFERRARAEAPRGRPARVPSPAPTKALSN
ncbi:hypothetical protein EVAR_48245_1 [Eumeta japonica]|uniref:Uncharacterized protein n=1 Tax=Eumeta variegata TaxID=151549 RepID=A0A4C1YIN9_EUMVA|nr:hypothetical protein EVAR_48245_1 [Eumeta japonica]